MTFNEFKTICCDFVSKNGNKTCGEICKNFTKSIKNKKLFECVLKFENSGYGRFYLLLDEHIFLVRDTYGWYYWQPFVTNIITDVDLNNFILVDIV